MFQKMIIGYDGSEESRVALKQAITFMHTNQTTQMVVAYVNEDTVGEDITYQTMKSGSILNDMTSTPMGTPNTIDSASVQQVAREYAVQLSESIQSQLDKHQVKAEIVAIDGEPTKALSNIAIKENADVIIVGNSGKSAFQKFFVGSVSEKLIAESPCSVLVVK